ncbi:MAG: hypothetical protein ACKV2Q_19325 [Planctomycetaceae bacterium]
MTIEDIRTAYYVEPFKPFLVRLGDGRKLLVSERNHIALSQIGDYVVVLHGDAISRVAVSNIAALESPKAKPRRKKPA